MIFTLPTKQVLPVVVLLSCLITNHGINAFDFDMDTVTDTSNTKSNDNLRTKDRDGARRLTEDIRPTKGTKIIGGDPVDAGEYPWFARAIYTIPFFGEIWWGCGASLVTPEFILSAAHCGWDTSARMQVGALCEPYGPGADKNCGQKIETIKVDKVFDHPNYDSVTSDFDFSLLRLQSRSTIEPVKMDMDNTSNGFVDGKIVYPIGVGTQKSGSSIYPDNVEDVAVPYVDNPSCNSKYGPGSITPAMMCAGDLVDGGEDACQGDSGGPLYDKDSETLVGVTSWGIGCGLRTFPGVYARVSNQWNAWIKPTICENHSEPKPEFCGGSPPPPPTSCEDEGEDTFEFAMRTDRYGADISWGIRELVDGEYVDFYGPKGSLGDEPYGNEKVYTETVCLPKDTCYKFGIYDSYGDGLCCRWGEGGYQISFNDDILQKSKFEDETLDTVDFGSC